MEKTSFPVTSLTRRRMLLGAGALLAASGLSSMNSLAADTGENGAVPIRAARRRVRIGYLRSADPLTLAHSHGSLEKSLDALGVDVQWNGPFEAYAPVAEALNAGRIDITMGSSTAAISSLAGHAPIVLFGYQRYAPEASGIVVPQTSQIRSVHDLIGKTVAVNRAGSGEYALVLALEHAGIPQSAVAKAYLNPADSAAAFSEGKVDAWSAWGPLYPMALTRLNGRILVTGREINSKNAVVFVAARSLADRDPDIVSAVYRTLRAESQWASANQKETALIWQRELGLPAACAELLASYRNDLVGPVGTAEIVEMDTVGHWMLEQKVIPVAPDVAHSSVLVKG